MRRPVLALLTAALAAHAGALTDQAAAEAQARALLPRLNLEDRIGQVSMAHVFRFTEGSRSAPLRTDADATFRALRPGTLLNGGGTRRNRTHRAAGRTSWPAWTRWAARTTPRISRRCSGRTRCTA
ncbi:hypothetical protein [Deinococcus actinosclerus]|uniref:Uncharacterized protein n=1 Tax=Deinococcus actinosclerus TaxID=1768108 RepID=A0ABM5X1Z7_9DEIO|nr:hypothetical protein [Deinococcus actinosclerus]ALW87697.1 hypothetical protein AUC44_01300 [Deinococcus actinosclerus]